MHMHTKAQIISLIYIQIYTVTPMHTKKNPHRYIHPVEGYSYATPRLISNHKVEMGKHWQRHGAVMTAGITFRWKNTSNISGRNQTATPLVIKTHKAARDGRRPDVLLENLKNV